MKDIIQNKLDRYQVSNEQDEENALKKITQEVALYALSKSGFFAYACFQGGTCLRIVHGLDRFSEDLDFALIEANPHFDLNPYLEKTRQLMCAYGYELEIGGKEKADGNVRKRFLKDESIKKILTFRHLTHTRKKINIKVELDVNPPSGAVLEAKFLDFPTDYSVSAHDPSSLFAGKLHALLCRQFVKGRDWYDFAWYVSQRIEPNYSFLKNALAQHGPWSSKDLKVDRDWLVGALSTKIRSMNWSDVIKDVIPFLRAEKRADVASLWSTAFFLSKIEKIPAPDR